MVLAVRLDLESDLEFFRETTAKFLDQFAPPAEIRRLRGDGGPLADRGIDFLMRQVGSIAGGTTEMSRNVLSERVLGMPREQTLDRGVPFRDVPRSAGSRSAAT
jgi:hypothetical protein